VFIIFVRPNAKCKIFIFCFLISLIHLMFAPAHSLRNEGSRFRCICSCLSTRVVEKIVMYVGNKSLSKYNDKYSQNFNFTCFSMDVILGHSYSSFINRCTFIKTLITIYIKIRWLLHVLVYDHHQEACN